MVDGAAVSHMCRCVAAIFVGSAFDVFVWSFWGAFVHIRTSCSVQECTMLVSVVECAFSQLLREMEGPCSFWSCQRTERRLLASEYNLQIQH